MDFQSTPLQVSTHDILHAHQQFYTIHDHCKRAVQLRQVRAAMWDAVKRHINTCAWKYLAHRGSKQTPLDVVDRTTLLETTQYTYLDWERPSLQKIVEAWAYPVNPLDDVKKVQAVLCEHLGVCVCVCVWLCVWLCVCDEPIVLHAVACHRFVAVCLPPLQCWRRARR